VHRIESWSVIFHIRIDFRDPWFKLYPGEYSIQSGGNELCRCQFAQIGRPNAGRHIFDLSPFERCLPFYNHIMRSGLPVKDVLIRSLDSTCPYGDDPIHFVIDTSTLLIYLSIRSDTLISKDSRSWRLYHNNESIVTFPSCNIEHPIDDYYKVPVFIPDSNTILPHLLSLSDLFVERATPQ
jgi:hypothetical protein